MVSRRSLGLPEVSRPMEENENGHRKQQQVDAWHKFSPSKATIEGIFKSYYRRAGFQVGTQRGSMSPMHSMWGPCQVGGLPKQEAANEAGTGVRRACVNLRRQGGTRRES
jgi:hypothetical protein